MTSLTIDALMPGKNRASLAELGKASGYSVKTIYSAMMWVGWSLPGIDESRQMRESTGYRRPLRLDDMQPGTVIIGHLCRGD